MPARAAAHGALRDNDRMTVTTSQPAASSRLFAPGRIGEIAIANRVVMAPLTRSRADEPAGDLPNELHVQYYRQRASAGLIVSEGTQVSPLGKGYRATPGIYSDAQVAGWRRVTEAVHAEGGRIVAQIWHVGRVTHPTITGGETPVAPSAIATANGIYSEGGRLPAPVPRALDAAGIAEVVAQFRRAAANALRAGFDGVEIHGANGYLIDQFLREGANQRSDDWGGTPEKRCRFALEVVDACVAEIGKGRVGIRLSPVSPANGLTEPNAQAVFGHLVDELARRGIAFIHFIEGVTGGARELAGFDFDAARRAFDGAVIVNNGYTREMAMAAVDEGRADAVAFGRAFISNPDLVRRLRENAPLAPWNPKTFYTPGPVGYTDYPTLDEERSTVA